MHNPNERFYGPVTVTAGMFSSEKTVSFQHGGVNVSLVVDSEDVSHNSKLRVRLVDQKADQAIIDLPRQPFSGNARLVVPSKTLSQ